MNAYLSQQDTERVDSISRINAAYILDTLPHRKYIHSLGSLFEFSVKLIDTISKGDRIGLIGMGYQKSSDEECEISTYILHEDGTIYAYDQKEGRIDKSICLAHLYMLLNPTDVGEWQFLMSSSNMNKQIGLQNEDHITNHTRYLLLQMEKVQSSIGRIL